MTTDFEIKHGRARQAAQTSHAGRHEQPTGSGPSAVPYLVCPTLSHGPRDLERVGLAGRPSNTRRVRGTGASDGTCHLITSLVLGTGIAGSRRLTTRHWPEHVGEYRATKPNSHPVLCDVLCIITTSQSLSVTWGVPNRVNCPEDHKGMPACVLGGERHEYIERVQELGRNRAPGEGAECT